jgi:hypothetical protein
MEIQQLRNAPHQRGLRSASLHKEHFVNELKTYAGQDQSEYGPAYRDHVVQIYKTYVEVADRISVRRETTNSFFLTLNTGLLGILGFLLQGANSPLGRTAMVPVAFAGVVIALLWYRMLRSYLQINSAKYRIIHELERSLPVRPYDAEWEVMGGGEDPSRYLPLTKVQEWVPMILAILHGFIAVWALPWGEFSSLLPGAK